MADFDLAVIGSGTGNSVIPPEYEGRSVALVSSGVFGGTCLNRGCIPTKMFVYTAEVGGTVRGAARYGVDAKVDGVRWGDIRDRIFDRIDPISDGGHAWRRDSETVTLMEGWAEFTAERTLSVDGGTPFTADQIVVATGSRAMVPDCVTAAEVPFETSDTVMRLDDLPGSVLILGGGYIAAEFAHVFSGLGVDVTLATRGPALLGAMDPAVSDRYTALASARWDVHLSSLPVEARVEGQRTVVRLASGTELAADLLLVATGRRPNSDRMGLERAGVELRPDGRVLVDDYGRTTADGVWALGDVSSPYQLKHVANAEGRAVSHNLAHPGDLRPMPHTAVPSAVFTEPQIATVGATSTELEAEGRPYVAATQYYGDTAYGWAMEETDAFCRVYADPASGLLLGAHVLGAQASTLIQPLIQAMSLGQRVQDVARGQYWIHPALSEVVENALLGLRLD